MQPVHLFIKQDLRAELVRRLRRVAPGVDLKDAVAKMPMTRVRRELRRFHA